MAHVPSTTWRFGLRTLALVGSAFVLASYGPAFAQTPNLACGPLGGGYGPFDYRTERGHNLKIVEMAHFTAAVEALIRGNTSETPAGDIDYTLRAFPNHHRALVSVMRWGEKTKSPQPRGLRYSVECYFHRAVQFRPDDAIVRMLFATFLYSKERTPEAMLQLETATDLAKDNPFTHYNIGLVYLDMKAYDKALSAAHRAYGLGFTRPDLKDALIAAKKWTEPPEQPAESPKPAASSAQ